MPFPEGFTLRAPVLADGEQVVSMMNEETEALIGVPLADIDWVTGPWKAPDADPLSFGVLEDPGGRIVGYLLVETRPPHTAVFGIGVIAIDRHGQGLGTGLVEEIERRAAVMAERAPAGQRVLMHMGALAGEPQISALLSGRGYEEVRRFWRMGIEFEGPPDPPRPIEGMNIRPFAPGDESETYRCLAEAFEDHWGDGFSTEEQWIKRHIEAAEEFHPDHWFLAWSNDEVAGALIGQPRAVQDPAFGYIEQLGVRRAHRGRGVGEALLRTSFCHLYESGRGGALLHVDSDSPTGADRLYERVGMTAIPQFATWEKELRPG